MAQLKLSHKHCSLASLRGWQYNEGYSATKSSVHMEGAQIPKMVQWHSLNCLTNTVVAWLHWEGCSIMKETLQQNQVYISRVVRFRRWLKHRSVWVIKCFIVVMCLCESNHLRVMERDGSGATLSIYCSLALFAHIHCCCLHTTVAAVLLHQELCLGQICVSLRFFSLD